MTLPPSLAGFLFAPISARGFSRMLVAWAVVTLGSLLLQWGDVTWFYTNEGLLPLPPAVAGIEVATRWSLLKWIHSSATVFMLYLVLLASLVGVALGSFSKFGKPVVRVSLVVSVFLLHAFHHRNPLLMGGGDVLLLEIGVVLMVSSWFIGGNFRFQNLNSQTDESTMPIWLYRLLLFQIIVIYISSAWSKLLGTTWMSGEAIATALQNPHFARFDLPVVFAEALSFIMSPLVIGWELLWLLLLIPHWKYHKRVKRWLLLSGIAFHFSILLLFSVGSFSFAMMVAYVGLWEEH